MDQKLFRKLPLKTEKDKWSADQCKQTALLGKALVKNFTNLQILNKD